MSIEAAPRKSIETGAETEPTVEDLGLLTPDTMVSPAEVTVGEPIKVTDADVAPVIVTSENIADTSDNGLTTGLEDIGVRVSTAARAYREDGKFLSQHEVDTISANQDLIREGMANRDDVSLVTDVDVSLAPELDLSVDSGAPAEVALVGESTPLNPDRLSARSLDRVAGFLADMSSNLAERRTASQVVSEIGDKASGAWESAKDIGAEQAEAAKKALTELGKKAVGKLVNIITAPSRGADRLFDAAEKGMANIEARAKSAKQRKAARIANRRMNRSIRTQERQDMAVAKEAKKDIKSEAKKAERDKRGLDKLKAETKRNQDIAAKREVARQKAEAARNQKANRRFERAKQSRETREAIAKKAAERAERVRSSAKRAGRRAVDAASGAASIFEATSKNLHDSGSEAIQSAKAKAKAKRNKFYNSQAAKAADRAERFYNKTASEGETVVVKVDSQRSEV